MEIKTKINKWDLIKLLWHNKGNYEKVKMQPSEWEKIFANSAINKGLIPIILNSSCDSISKKRTTQSKNGRKIYRWLRST